MWERSRQKSDGSLKQETGNKYSLFKSQRGQQTNATTNQTQMTGPVALLVTRKSSTRCTEGVRKIEAKKVTAACNKKQETHAYFCKTHFFKSQWHQQTNATTNQTQMADIFVHLVTRKSGTRGTEGDIKWHQKKNTNRTPTHIFLNRQPHNQPITRANTLANSTTHVHLLMRMATRLNGKGVREGAAE